MLPRENERHVAPAKDFALAAFVCATEAGREVAAGLLHDIFSSSSVRRMRSAIIFGTRMTQLTRAPPVKCIVPPTRIAGRPPGRARFHPNGRRASLPRKLAVCVDSTR
jgi:hypothetical protein